MIRKSLIALAAAAALSGLSGSANATSLYLSFGHGGHGFYGYLPITYKCFWKTKRVKVVKWVYGEKIVTWKKIRVKVCPRYVY